MNDGHSGRLTEREIFIYHVVTWATSGGSGFDVRKLCPLLTSSQIDELLLDLDDEVQNFAINEAERKHDFKKLRQKPNSVAELDVAPSEKKDWQKWYEKPEFSEDTVEEWK